MKKSFYLKYLENSRESESKVKENKLSDFFIAKINVCEILKIIGYLIITLILSIGATAILNSNIRNMIIQIIKDQLLKVK